MGSHKKANQVVLKSSLFTCPRRLTAGVVSDTSISRVYHVYYIKHWVSGVIYLRHEDVPAYLTSALSQNLTVSSFNLHQPERGARNNSLPVKRFSFFPFRGSGLYSFLQQYSTLIFFSASNVFYIEFAF